MDKYNVILDPVELISGSSSITSPVYIEVARTIESNTPRAMEYLKDFITSIEKIAGGVNDKRITSTKGNVTKFAGYDDIKTIIDFLTANLSGVSVIKELIDIHKALLSYQTQYMDGYEKQVRLIILEYESALYLLVTGLSYAMANNIDIVQTGTKIIAKKKSGSDKGVINKTITGLAKQLKAKEHQEYLKQLLDGKDNKPVNESVEVYEENSAISDTLDIIDALSKGVSKIYKWGTHTFQLLKRTVFGIVPLIRCIIYMRYKKKADTILALEQQANFVRENINRLQNQQSMDEKKKAIIIKKQEAFVTAYIKRANKLRAELIETEKDTATELKDKPKSETKPETKSDGDLVLDANKSSKDGGRERKKEEFI